MIDFNGTTNGGWPAGSLFSDGTYFYGMTGGGGTHSLGTIFKVMPDGTGYSKLLDFAGGTNGSFPNGNLISDGTFLYGLTFYGGISGDGTIFRIKPDGTRDSVLLNFSGMTNGQYPSGSLIYDGTFLYGVTFQGGANNLGTVFRIKPDGSGDTTLFTFDGTPNGSKPYGSLISDGTFLYGMTSQGGTYNDGVVFKIKSDGTGYSRLLNFAGATNGSHPAGSLFSDGTFLYGMTTYGGANGMGTAFKLLPNGTGFTELLDFTGTTNGSFPNGSFISDGTFLYAMTSGGGANNDGTLFKIKSDGTGYAKMLDFDGATNGSNPDRDLIYDGTFFYGLTLNGGASDDGTLFRFEEYPAGIGENNLQTDFYVYPNPSSGKFILKWEEEQRTNADMEIYNSLGEKVMDNKQMINGEFQIDLSDQPNGIYFVNVKTDKESLIQRIIISR